MTDSSTKPVLGVIIASTRPGRIGKPIGDWFTSAARGEGSFEIRVLDLAEINLPFLDEPNHPRMQKYTQPHTIAWSEQVAACDAFVFVHPEYNYSPPATLINALDYLNKEWANKPAGLVSYGGVSAGLRAASHLKEIMQSLMLLCVQPAVSIPFAQQHIDDNKVFTPPAENAAAVEPMLKAILERHEVLSQLR